MRFQKSFDDLVLSHPLEPTAFHPQQAASNLPRMAPHHRILGTALLRHPGLQLQLPHGTALGATATRSRGGARLGRSLAGYPATYGSGRGQTKEELWSGQSQ